MGDEVPAVNGLWDCLQWMELLFPVGGVCDCLQWIVLVTVYSGWCW